MRNERQTATATDLNAGGAEGTERTPRTAGSWVKANRNRASREVYPPEAGRKDAKNGRGLGYQRPATASHAKFTRRRLGARTQGTAGDCVKPAA